MMYKANWFALCLKMKRDEAPDEGLSLPAKRFMHELTAILLRIEDGYARLVSEFLAQDLKMEQVSALYEAISELIFEADRSIHEFELYDEHSFHVFADLLPTEVSTFEAELVRLSQAAVQTLEEDERSRWHDFSVVDREPDLEQYSLHGLGIMRVYGSRSADFDSEVAPVTSPDPFIADEEFGKARHLALYKKVHHPHLRDQSSALACAVAYKRTALTIAIVMTALRLNDRYRDALDKFLDYHLKHQRP